MLAWDKNKVAEFELKTREGNVALISIYEVKPSEYLLKTEGRVTFRRFVTSLISNPNNPLEIFVFEGGKKNVRKRKNKED